MTRHSKRIAAGCMPAVLAMGILGCPGLGGVPADCTDLETTTREQARAACPFIADENVALAFEVLRWNSIQQVTGDAACPRDATVEAETESCMDNPEGQSVADCIACRTGTVNAIFTEGPCSFDELPAEVLAECPASQDKFINGDSCRLATAYTGIAALVDAGLTRDEVLVFNPMQCQPLNNFEACFGCTIAMLDYWFAE